MTLHENSRPCHVQACTLVTCDSYFGPICYKELQEMVEGFSTDSGARVIQVTVLNKILISRSQSKKPWYVYMQVARDIFEQNIQLHRSRDGHVFIRSTKTINEGEELKYWFDDKLARELNIPYLAPSNIIGICRYSCHVCHQEFLQPNPLKLHIMHHNTDGTVTMTSPWILRNMTSPRIMTSSPSDIKTDIFNHSINSFSKSNHSPRHPDYVDSPNYVDSDRDVKHQVGVKSKTTFVAHGGQSLPRYTLTASIELVPSAGYSPSPVVPYRQETMEKGNTKCCAKIELQEREPMEVLKQRFSLASSKKGHLCVFCGKLYSRKYGLKIHLRTHTGYKPLRCKYCFRAFGDPSNLNKHIRLHAQGSTPYQCTYCSKILVRRRDLMRHLKSRHSNEVANH